MNLLQIIVLGVLLLSLLLLFIGGLLVNTGRHDEPEAADSQNEIFSETQDGEVAKPTDGGSSISPAVFLASKP